MNTHRFASVVVLLILCTTFVLATVPNCINFQGMLTDSSGTPLNRSIDRMQFSIYADSVGGTSLWTESHSGVQVTDGLFRVILGSSNPLPSSLFNGSVRWISFMASPDMQDLSPRQPLVTVPYVFRAGLAETVQIPLHLTGDTALTAIIWGTNTTENGFAIVGENGATHCYGYLGGNYYGVFGWNQNFNQGYLGHNDYGVRGTHGASGNYGYLGSSSFATYGENGNGNAGYLGGVFCGAYGTTPVSGAYGALGFGSAGVYGRAGSSGPYGIMGNDSIGVSGYSSVSTGGGVYGKNTSSGTYGWLGTSSYGVYGRYLDSNYGYLGSSIAGVYGRGASASGYGGYFYSTGSSGYGGYCYASGASGIGIYARGGSGGKAGIFRGNVVLQSASSGSTVLELGEGLDYSEGFDVAQKEDTQPGTVLVIDPDHPGKLTKSTQPYDSKVAGIIAGAKGLGSGVRLGTGQFDHNVALAGRVYCNVDASDSDIVPGDLLTTSAIPGYAMRASDYSQAQGAILGKAMERLEKGQKGQILVLVTLQ